MWLWCFFWKPVFRITMWRTSCMAAPKHCNSDPSHSPFSFLLHNRNGFNQGEWIRRWDLERDCPSFCSLKQKLSYEMEIRAISEKSLRKRHFQKKFQWSGQDILKEIFVLDSSSLTPRLGTSICCRCGPQETHTHTHTHTRSTGK